MLQHAATGENAAVTAIPFKLFCFVLLDFLLMFQPGDFLFSPLDFLVNGFVIYYQFSNLKGGRERIPAAWLYRLYVAVIQQLLAVLSDLQSVSADAAGWLDN